MSFKSIAGALVLGAALIGGVLFHQPRDPAPATVAIDERPEQARATNRQLRQAAASALPDPGPLPASLQGARHDVQLGMGESGDLLLQEDLLHLFDFYIAGSEEEDLRLLLARIHRDLAARLQGRALEQARDLLRRYVDYRIALKDLPRMERNLQADALRQRLAALNAMRRQHFSEEEYQVFFAAGNAEDEYMIQRLAITQQVPEQDRQEQLDALEQALPESLRQARQASVVHADLHVATGELRAQGASDEEIRRLREQTLGHEAADALAELDQRQQAWQRRLRDYAQARDRLREAGLAEMDLQAALVALQERSFDEQERLRVRALDPEL